jgi:thiamine phosphate synthase YjbQ (UPF0047 family)
MSGHFCTCKSDRAKSSIPLQATLQGPSLTVPVCDGQPVLGTWQQIFHIECDFRPPERTVVVTVLAE